MGDFFRNITSSKVMRDNKNNNYKRRTRNGDSSSSEESSSAPMGGLFNWFGSRKNEENSSSSAPVPMVRRGGNNRRGAGSNVDHNKKPFNALGDQSARRGKVEIPPGAILLAILLVILGLLFYFGRRIWDYITSKAKTFLPVGETTKKCPTGCHIGKCTSGEGDCKTDMECNMCEDETGTFYALTEPDNRPEEVKSAEDQNAADMRLRSLESTIEERNREIQKLNRYIETVNHDRLQAELLLKKTLETSGSGSGTGSSLTTSTTNRTS